MAARADDESSADPEADQELPDIDRTAREHWRDTHGVRMTDHAIERWDERTPPETIAPETAYERGVEVPDQGLRLVVTVEDSVPDGARVWCRDDSLAVVFVIEENGLPAVTTVKRLDYWYDWPARMYLRSVFVDGGGGRGQ